MWLDTFVPIRNRRRVRSNWKQRAKLALEMLGVGPCYHMLEVRKNPSHRPVWLQATRHQPVDWDALFIDYNSGVDWPIATFWRELSEYYPDAKFILTQRDPQRWYKSISNTIFKSLTGRPMMIRNDV